MKQFTKEEALALLEKHPELADCGTQYEDGSWGPAIPEPFYYSFFPWIWKRLSGWKDEYGRPAQIIYPWEF